MGKIYLDSKEDILFELGEISNTVCKTNSYAEVYDYMLSEAHVIQIIWNRVNFDIELQLIFDSSDTLYEVRYYMLT